jgi:hypothetical protein
VHIKRCGSQLGHVRAQSAVEPRDDAELAHVACPAGEKSNRSRLAADPSSSTQMTSLVRSSSVQRMRSAGSASDTPDGSRIR